MRRRDGGAALAGHDLRPVRSYTGTPENLAREAGWWLGPKRMDFSGLLRARYESIRLTDAQVGAIRWLAAQPDGPAKILVISEEWSSGCRRDVPALARLAEAGGLELQLTSPPFGPILLRVGPGAWCSLDPTGGAR